jgi:hypothetical protein|tara:strand:+ start:309 stop:488 length:180 start_codon:yes stop_codon:yes gene_type:complete
MTWIDYSASIYLEGEYNNDLYDLQAVEEFFREQASKGYVEEQDIITVNEVLVSGGAVWQ